MNLTDFFELTLDVGALKLGEFTLKSGRQSPYFFNAGLFRTGGHMAKLSHFYAQKLKESTLEFDMLFGPAYKGIPLVTATAMAYYQNYGIDLPFAYDRKEAKDHGEGGKLVGAPLQGRVMIVDDVITAGTAIRQSIALIRQAGAQVAGVIVALDRMEKGQGELSAIQELSEQEGIPVLAVARLTDLMNFLKAKHQLKDFHKLEAYREKYGI